MFGYKSHISIDRRYGFIRKAKVTSADQSDGRQLPHVIDTNNTAASVGADTACHSKKNKRSRRTGMLKSRIQHRNPKGKALAERTAGAKAANSAVRARAEHVLAHQKNRYGLSIRTIGLARAQAELALAKFSYNFDRLIFYASGHEPQMDTRSDQFPLVHSDNGNRPNHRS